MADSGRRLDDSKKLREIHHELVTIRRLLEKWDRKMEPPKQESEELRKPDLFANIKGIGNPRREK